MYKFLGMDTCPKCGANEVIAIAGTFKRCARCYPGMWDEIGDLQKSNFLKHGSVNGYGQRRGKKNAKK